MRASDLSLETCAQGYMLRYLTLVLTLFAVTSCYNYSHLVRKGHQSTPARECGKCHIDAFREWEDSAHAKSFVNSEFRDVTDDYGITACLGCHAPETVFTDGDPKARSYLREEGVTCVSCHLDDGKLAGPLKGLLAPHPIHEGDQRFLKSDICGKCHSQEFQDWQKLARPDKKTCQGCHMPAVLRKVIQDEPWQRIKRPKDSRRHTFDADTPEVLRNAVTLGFNSIVLDKDRLTGTVLVENRKAGHSLPSGRFGYRKVELVVAALDAGGRVLAQSVTAFFVEMKDSIPAGGQKLAPFAFELLPEKPAAVQARLVYQKGEDASRVIPLAEITVRF